MVSLRGLLRTGLGKARRALCAAIRLFRPGGGPVLAQPERAPRAERGWRGDALLRPFNGNAGGSPYL